MITKDAVVRLADLAVARATIKDRRFENCLILGPAVVIPTGGGVISDCEFDGSLEETIWEIPENVGRIGAIGLDNTDFISCRFQGVGFAGPAEFVRYFSDSLK